MFKRKYMCLFIIINLLYGCQQLEPKKPSQQQTEEIKQNDNGEETMNLHINEKIYQVKLYNNSTVTELLKLLPMTITMDELHDNEKYYYFHQSLPTHNETIEQIKTGDIMLFQNNCLVLFYKDFQTSYQYTRIGYIEDVTDLRNQLGSKSITITFKKQEENK